MTAFEAIPTAVAELVAYVVGKATGRTFELQQNQAQRIGEYLVIALVISAGLVMTLVYS